MKNILLGIIFFFLFLMSSYSQIHEYSFEFIKTIKIGNRVGEIGYNEKVAIAGLPQTPRTFYASSTKIYIPDYVNVRVNIYNPFLDFLYAIDEKDIGPKISSAFRLAVDNNDDIIAANGHGLVKIDKNGVKKLDMPDHIYMGIRHIDLFPIKDHLVYYTENGLIKLLTPEGVIKDSDDAIKFLLQNESDFKNTYITKGVPKEKLEKALELIERLKKDKKHIIIDDKFYTASFYELKNYFNEIEAYRNLINTVEKEKNNIKLSQLKLSFQTYLGYDSNHNSYWDSYINDSGKSIILILSRIGNIEEFALRANSSK